MKHFLWKLLAFTLIVLVGCEKDESTTSALIGTWDLVKIEIDGESGPIYSSSSLKFTTKTVTIYDEDDVFNAVPIEYEYKDGTIWIMGAGVWKVISLNSSTLILLIDGETLTYRKR